MTVQGSCLCGNINIEVDVDKVQAKEMCHCDTCRHQSGSIFAMNLMVVTPKITKGSPKEYQRTADSGATVTCHFCGDCGTSLFNTDSALPGLSAFKLGCLDDRDLVAKLKPQTESYASRRAEWLPEIEGVVRKG